MLAGRHDDDNDNSFISIFKFIYLFVLYFKENYQLFIYLFVIDLFIIKKMYSFILFLFTCYFLFLSFFPSFFLSFFLYLFIYLSICLFIHLLVISISLFS